MTRDVRLRVRKCEICQASKLKPQGGVASMPVVHGR